MKKNSVGHPIGPFRADDPVEADIYDWFAYGTGNRGDGDGDGLAWPRAPLPRGAAGVVSGGARASASGNEPVRKRASR